jgi:hypothetical protein
MTSGLKLSSARVHSARSADCSPATVPNRSRQRGPLLAWLAAGRGPRPHATRARRGALGPGALRARAVARLAATRQCPNLGKVYTASFPRARCTRFTRLRAQARSEEGERQRGGTHRCGRRCQSSTTVKVLVLRVGVQLWTLVKLWGMRTRREVGVRWLGTNEAVENKGECGGDNLPKGDTTRVRMRCRCGLFL